MFFFGVKNMPRVPFAEKCSQVYNYLVKSLSEGLPPTVREICRDCAIKSTSTVHKILDTLEENGYITRDAHSSRAIRVNKMSASAHIPVLGRVTAGQPILAVEDIEDYIPYPTKDADGLFALRVVGFSMKNVGILDGDIVVAESDEYGGIIKRVDQINGNNVHLVSDNKQVSYENINGVIYEVKGITTWVDISDINGVVIAY